MLVEGDVPDNRSAVRKAIARYMNPQVYRMMTEKENLQGGTIVEATCMVIHLRGLDFAFTDPREEVSYLNRYLGTIIPIVLNNDGTHEELSAHDSTKVFWGPLPHQENHALLAVTTALELKQALAPIQNALLNTQIGIGINSGEMFYGNIGNIDQIRFGVYGNAVRTAYYLAEHAYPDILIGENTYNILSQNPTNKINVLRHVADEPRFYYSLLPSKEKLP